jgi:xylulokinase/glycerol kinase
MIAVLDVGTTACRTTLFDVNGKIKGVEYREYDNIYLSSKAVEQNPEVWTKSLLETMKDCLRRSKEASGEIEAIIVVSQRATIMPVNKSGDPLSNAVLWLDKRSLKECSLIRSRISEQIVFNKTGLRVDPYFSAPKILWIRENRPEVYSDTYKFLTVHDYVVFSLTGEVITDQTQASRTMLFNVDDRCWDHEILEVLDIDMGKLPEVYVSGSVAGELDRSIAEKTGFPTGIPVLAGGGDQQFAAIGLGVIEEGRLGVVTGGGSFAICHSKRSLRDRKMRILCSASAIPGKWMLEAGIFTAGSVYKWFKDVFGQVEVALSGELNKRPYELLDMEAEADSPLKPSGLILIPHFAGSAAPHWNPLAKGLIFNLTLHTRRKDIIKAVLESICLEVKKNIAIMEAVTGKKIEEVYAGGGASRSPLFNKIQADVYGKPVVQAADTEAPSLGAAMVCGVKLGHYKDLRDASRIIKVGSRMNPHLRLSRQYEDILAISESIYDALKDRKIYVKASEILDFS